jgi:putative peptide zinc metalloprotease protein
LCLHDAGLDISGSRGAIIEDPVRARFFRMPGRAAEILPSWDLGKVETIMRASGTGLDEVRELFQFLEVNRLLQLPASGLDALVREHKHGDKGPFHKALHGYLFFRVPLFNPTRILDSLLPFARGLINPCMLLLVAVLGMTGFYFAARQWDKFVSSFAATLNLQGAATFAFTLVILKIFHELGHGLVARNYRCRVPLMGIAFMVLTPMLYTEVSDAWKLSNRLHRMRIAAAGVAVELAIASLALFAWVFLPDGTARNAAFFVATSAWMLSLLVNLSPFMRFDGYHILGDVLGMYNHGPRATGLACWQIRKWLLGVVEDPPEYLPRNLTRGLIAFAFGTMIYRLSLFTGIALLVYHMFPKIIGLPLAALEIMFFVLLPVWREMKTWNDYGGAAVFKSFRARINLAIASVMAVLLLSPLDQSVSVPALVVAAEESWVFTPEKAAIAEIHVGYGEHVEQGEVLLRLHSIWLASEIAVIENKLDLVEARLRQTLPGSSEALASLQVLQRQKAETQMELAGLEKRRARLTIRAPVSGRVNALLDALQIGEFVGPEDPLLHVAGMGGAKLVGLANERDAMRLQEGAEVSFISEDGAMRAISASVESIGIPGGAGVSYDYLSSSTGGPIATAKNSDGTLSPDVSVLPITMTADLPSPLRVIRGIATISAAPTSVFYQLVSRVVVVLRRESTF